MRRSDVRGHNLTAVLDAIRQADTPLSRADIAMSTQLTRPAVSSLVEQLVMAGFLEELPPQSRGAGRPIVPIVLAKRSFAGLGVEIAADHLSYLALDLTGAELARGVRRVSTVDLSIPAVAELAAEMVAQARVEVGQLQLSTVHVAVPGRVNRTDGSIVSAPNLGWSQVHLAEALEQTAGCADVEVRIDNDSRLAALTEIENRPGASFLYVRGSTGIGGAVVLDGTAMEGSHGWAGEIGHTVVRPGGRRCRCGRQGCLEAYASQHALREMTRLGEDVPIHDLLDALSAETGRSTVIEKIGGALGLAVANALNVLDLNTVVLSGYFAPVAEELTPVVQSTIDEHALAREAGPVVVERADDTSDPALRGAARASLEELFADPGRWKG